MNRPSNVRAAICHVSVSGFVILLFALTTTSPSIGSELEEQLRRAGDNADQLRQALAAVAPEHQAGIKFLIENMPERDLRSSTAEFLKEHVELAYTAWQTTPWHSQVSEELFLNEVLPYAVVNERRDPWRGKFYEDFSPLVKEAKNPTEAAAILNNNVFKLVKVKYSTKRKKADQSPFESMESGLASCTGLSILLVDACRAVGVPARFVGTPLWSDRSGNHSWVEVWDGDWHFTGAAEATGMRLDEGWFTERAAAAKRDEPRFAIYATSFRKTPLLFPCIWQRGVDYVYAVNVTERYTRDQHQLPDGHGMARFSAIDDAGERIVAAVEVQDSDGNVLFRGTARDERFDSNDHLWTTLPKNAEYNIVVSLGEKQSSKKIRLNKDEQLFAFKFSAADATVAETDSTRVDDPLQQLKQFLAQSPEERGDLATQPFADAPLTKVQAAKAKELLWEAHVAQIRDSRAQEMKERVLVHGEFKMPFAYFVFGEKPEDGRSLYISLHGGGNAPKKLNDQQWQNQQHLYSPQEGVYLCPHAPTNTWDLWHQAHIDPLFDRLIEDLVVFEDVNPNRVYLMGYSAGGDGVYQLAPRMADRWAAAAMMAGHPNDASALGLRNIGFALYMGGQDAAYQRNEVARQWEKLLADLHNEDPKGYRHLVTIYEDKGHWMDHQDASSIDWMRQQTRDPLPSKIVWKEDNVTHHRFYWLWIEAPQEGSTVTATRTKQTIDFHGDGVDSITIRLNDQMLDLDQPVRVTCAERVLFEGRVPRTIQTLDETIKERGDPAGIFTGAVSVSLQQ